MNRICKLFGIKYPIIQGGMVWCSGWRLASAVSNAGGLGLLGAGSMHPEVLREHIRKYEREGSGTAYGGNQAKCGCFFPSVMSSGFETFGNNRIHTGFLTFDGKQGTAHYMDDRYAVFFQERSPFFWTSRRGENDFYSLFDHQVHQTFDFRIHQRYINPERFVGGSPAFPDIYFVPLTL